VVSFKPCWQDAYGGWLSDGGFPLQMAALGSLFDRVTIVVTRSAPREGGSSLPGGAEVVALREPLGADGRRKLSVLANAGYYLREISARIRKADVVHAPVPGDIALLGMILALAQRKRLIARYGSSWALTPQTTLSQRFTRFCMRTFAGGRNVMIATGAGVHPPAPGMRWLYTTALTRAELTRIQPVFERGLSQPLRLVYAGRLSSEKGVIHLVRALDAFRTRARGPMPSLTVLGDGPDRQPLEAAVRHSGLAGIVRFRGHVDRRQLSEELMRADVSVQPSLTEGLCKAWLDSMAHGLPVLSSRVGAAEAVIGRSGERGWLVPPGDGDALADALTEIVDNDRDWPSLRRRCRAFVDDYTIENWAEAIGETCAEQWGGVLERGKLCLKEGTC
jgi:glycosyltransferase involved in cell wall biosynthesis